MVAIGFDGTGGVAGLAGDTGICGRVKVFVADVDALFLELGDDALQIGAFGEFDPDAGGVAVEGGGVDEADTRRGKACAVEFGEFGKLPLDSGFAIGDGDFRLFAGAGKDVKAELGVVLDLGERFEGEKGDGLFLEFVDSGAAGLAGGLEEGDDGAGNGLNGVEIVEKRGEEPGSWVGDKMYVRFDGVGLEERGAEDGA